MPVVSCASCSARLKVPAEKLSKRLRCPRCRNELNPAVASGPVGAAPAAAGAFAAPRAAPAPQPAAATVPYRRARPSADTSMPPWLTAMLIGTCVGAGYGFLLYALLGLVFGVGMLPADAVDGSAVIVVLVIALVGAVIHTVFGLIIGLTVGLTQSAGMGYLVAILLSLVGIFFGGCFGILGSLLFAWIVVSAIRSSLDV